MIKECTTIEEYENILNEYLKYHHSRWAIGISEQGCKDLIEGLSFKITKAEQFKDEKIRKFFGSNVSILDESLPLLGRYCICDKQYEGEFIGIEVTEEDFYYMVRNNATGNVLYSTCCGGIEDKFPNIDYNGGTEKRP